MEEMNHKPKTAALTMKLTKKESDAVKQFCKDKGISLSDYVRKLLYAQLCPKVKTEPPDLE